jgi:hypothetical protein
MLSVGLFNFLVNPYGIFDSPEITGFNQSKPEKLKNMRLFKAVDITRIKPETIFLGSSRTEYGLNPNYAALKDKQSVYNLALGAATPYELLRYLQHALVNQPKLKLVILGLDEFMFNELNQENPGLSEQRLEKKHSSVADIVSSTLSLNAFYASQTTIALSQKYPEYQSYTPQGMLNLRIIDRNDSATLYRFEKSIGFYFQTFPQYRLSDRYLNLFKQIVSLCKQKKIDLKVFISPAHATRWETVWTAGHWQQFEQMKREIAKITPVWDFSGYNSITTEPLSNRMKNYVDDSHYRQEIGNLIFNRILSYQGNRVPNDFGILITPTNIESHLQKIRNDRKAWAIAHPKEVDFVLKIGNRQSATVRE